ncbi:di-trans,poly-cis-decaprenylcistransferase [Paenibacillus sepulcri]|uniref:Di-trans,poly-cis-decaprenylcistransferase n=1 Tax=Paenibacillus sepulcri TaxID=359917 RepID=A0ABS7C9A9_9BACL|nr:di-trans,poly-cis-decaprenylcistransferase [Paenibacillus sepulcri]
MLFGLNHSVRARFWREKINWNAVLPRHIAIMMDGNGRWATRRGLPRTAGHFAGMQTMRRTIRFCRKNNVEFLTLYAFSTENWKRPRAEIDYIISLIHEFITDDTLDEMNRNKIRINFIGDISRFSAETQDMMRHAAALTKSNTDMTVNFAVNYCGRSEIIHALKSYLKDGAHELTEEEFERFL